MANKNDQIKIKKYKELQDRLNHHFDGCLDIEMIVEAFIEYDKQFTRDEKLAEAMLITNDSVRKFHEWESLEKQGKLIKLPVTVGDTVWYISEKIKKQGRKKFTIPFIDRGIVDDVTFGCLMVPQITVCNDKNIWTTFDSEEDFGKIVFLTKEKVEAAFKELEGKNENT